MPEWGEIMADGSVTIEITGDASEFNKALQDVSKGAVNKLESSLSGVEDALRNVTQAASRVDGGGLEEATDAANDLSGAAEDAARTMSEAADAATDVDGGGLSEAADAAGDLAQEAGEAAGEVGELGGELEEAGGSASMLGEIFKGNLLANLATQGIDLALDAVKALGEGLVDVTKQAVTNFAQYEQLVGGVETLFGASADTVKNYAANAYQTAGMSANQYMETVTSFSATLLQGLGGDTAAAAEVANVAITDMADNVNKMGSSMGSVQDAYQGFAKQNYTMLDNLKLGYGGTQEEMIRLINDSGVLNETISSLDGISFDTIISAIHAIQTQMGITGTTAAEASGTIEGSIAATQAAWQNLLTGLADPSADIGVLMDNFVNTATTALDNLLPRISTVLEGIGPLVAGIAPKLAEYAPQMITAAASLISALAEGLAAAAPVLAAQAPQIVAAIGQGLLSVAGSLLDLGAALIESIATGIWNGLGAIKDAIVGVFTGAKDSATSEAESFSDAGQAAGDALASGVESGGGAATSAMETVVANMEAAAASNTGSFTGVGQDIASNTASGVNSGAGSVASAAGAMTSNAKSSADAQASAFTGTGASIAQETGSGIQSNSAAMSAAIDSALATATADAEAKASLFNQVGANIMNSIQHGISSGAAGVSSAIRAVLTTAWSVSASSASMFTSVGLNIARGIASGINSGTSFVAAAARAAVAAAKAAAEAAAGIHSPSTLFRDAVGWFISLGIASGIEKGTGSVIDAIDGIIEQAVKEAESQIGILGDVVAKQVEGVYAEIAAIEAEQQRRKDADELKQYERSLRDKNKKLADLEKDYAEDLQELEEDRAEAASKRTAAEREKAYKTLAKKEKELHEKYKEDKAKALEDLQDLQDDWAEKQLQKQEAAEKARLKAQIDALEDYKKAWEDACKDLLDEYTDTLEGIQKEQDDFAKGLKDTGYLTYKNGIGQLKMHDLSKDTKAINEYGDALLALRDRGVDDSLWNEILGMDMADATSYANKLLKMSDEAYEAYLGTYAEKQAAAEKVAEAIFGPVQEAAEQDFMATLPEKLEDIGNDAMASLADSIDADGQLAVDAAAQVADSIIAEIERINLAVQLRNEVMSQVAETSAKLASSTGNAQAAASAQSFDEAMQSAVLSSSMNQKGEPQDVVLTVDGMELARVTTDYFRAVDDQSPRIVSD